MPYIFCVTGEFLIDKVAPTATGESAKVKVKLRVNIHGIFMIPSASIVETVEEEKKEEEKEEKKEEPMEVENGKEKATENGPKEEEKAEGAGDKDEPVS